MDDSRLISLTSKRLGNWIRQYRHSVFASLPVAEHDLMHIEIDVMHLQPQAFERPQSGAIKQVRHQTFLTGQLFKRLSSLGSRENTVVSSSDRCPNPFEQTRFLSHCSSPFYSQFRLYNAGMIHYENV